MSFSQVGKNRFMIYGVVLLVNLIVLAISGHINQFQEFYYKADLVPFGLSLATGIWVAIMMVLDATSKNASSAKPAFELTWLSLVSLLWLGFNAFSTDRWKFVNSGLCQTIPSNSKYDGYRTWCSEVQALRAFIWIEWVMFLLTFIYLLRWSLDRHNSGRKDVWATSFSRFQEIQERPLTSAPSEFLQWEKFDQPVQPARAESVNYFQPPPAIQAQGSDGYVRDSSVPPLTTAYARAQYEQRQQAQAYEASQMQYSEQPSYPQYVSQHGAQFSMSQPAQYGAAPDAY